MLYTYDGEVDSPGNSCIVVIDPFQIRSLEIWWEDQQAVCSNTFRVLGILDGLRCAYRRCHHNIVGTAVYMF